MQLIDYTNIIHSFYLIWSICVHHQCVSIALWLHFGSLTLLNYIQQTQILAGPLCLSRARPRRYSGVFCLMQREVAMATGFLLGVRCEALMHEV